MTTNTSSNESQVCPPPQKQNTCPEKQTTPLPRQITCPEIQSNTIGKGRIFPDLPERSSPPSPISSLGATLRGWLASATKALPQNKKGAFFLYRGSLLACQPHLDTHCRHRGAFFLYRGSLLACCFALLCFLLSAPATATPNTTTNPAANRATTSARSKTPAPRNPPPSASTKPSPSTSSSRAPAALHYLPPQPKAPPPSPPQRKVSSDWDHPYLLAAYALVWLALLLYVFFLSRRQRQTEKLLYHLEAQQSALEDLLHEKNPK